MRPSLNTGGSGILLDFWECRCSYDGVGEGRVSGVGAVGVGFSMKGMVLDAEEVLVDEGVSFGRSCGEVAA